MNFPAIGPHRRRHPARLAAFVVLLLGGLLVAGWVVMMLWNAVLVPALGARPLGFWQALGLLLLCRLLVGNWGPRRHGGPWRPPGPRGPAATLRDRWDHMSPEQRERLREQWSARCGNRTPAPPQD